MEHPSHLGTDSLETLRNRIMALHVLTAVQFNESLITKMIEKINHAVPLEGELHILRVTAFDEDLKEFKEFLQELLKGTTK